MPQPSRSSSPASVILWRCPRCGKVELNSGQSARYCGATKRCTTAKLSGIIESTKMERWRYVPAGTET